MKPIVAVLLLVLPAYWIYHTGRAWKKNIEAAKRSGLPYVVSPIYLYHPFWMLTHKLWLPLLRRLPANWTDNWIDFMTPDWAWEKGYSPFARNGDTFCTAAPGGILVWTVDADAVTQICARRDAFPKPLESYEILNIFGKNLLSTEGHTWKAHRKITSPSFNEKNNVLVFEEAVNQSQQMLKHWTGPEGRGNITLDTVATDTLRTTLHIISRVGFGVSLLWPGEEPKNKEEAISSEELVDGHTMSFARALGTLLERLLLVVLIPTWLLKHIPMKSTKEAYESFVEWGKYMNEVFEQKVEEAKAGKITDGMDIMGSLVRSSYGVKKEKAKSNKISLTDDEILGNAFVIVVAGHETTANALHFALMELAVNPSSQRLLQSEVDSIFGGKAPDTWDYDQYLNKLTGSMVGAVMNELLRVIPSVIVIPKQVTKHSSQHITLAGKKHELPAGAAVNLSAVGTMRNPKYWPSLGPSKISGKSDDLDDFVPERWLRKLGEEDLDTGSGSVSASEQTDSEDDSYTKHGPRGPDTSSHLFHPTRGSYLPFSEGARSCIGRRFAQVEILAILAVIFQKFSIELAVDEWASDEEVEGMEKGGEERRKVYDVAREKARVKIQEASSLITLKLQSGYIPVRVMRRGEERFIGDIE